MPRFKCIILYFPLAPFFYNVSSENETKCIFLLWVEWSIQLSILRNPWRRLQLSNVIWEKCDANYLSTYLHTLCNFLVRCYSIKLFLTLSPTLNPSMSHKMPLRPLRIFICVFIWYYFNIFILIYKWFLRYSIHSNAKLIFNTVHAK